MVVYKDPNDKKLQKWYDYNCGKYDIWYDTEVHIFRGYHTYKYGADIDPILPPELITCLNKIKEYLYANAEDFKSYCPVKHEHVDFIYKDEVYSISANTFELNELKCLGYMDSEYFSDKQAAIRGMLEEELGVKYSRFDDFID